MPQGKLPEEGSGLALRLGPNGHRRQHTALGVQAAEAKAWREGRVTSGRGGKTHVTETDASCQGDHPFKFQLFCVFV